jgi:antitoxin ParD1/3/4
MCLPVVGFDPTLIQPRNSDRQEVFMSTVDKRSITLSPELAAEVDEAVAAGEYASASEVVRDALRQWKERRDLFGYTLEELRALVQEGIDSGPGRFASMAEIKAEARRRFVEANKRSA